MWRIFRGIKSNSYSGGQTHFRIFGSSYGNTDNEEETDDCIVFGALSNKENYEASCHLKTSLARKANLKYLKDFKAYVSTPIEDEIDRSRSIPLTEGKNRIINKKTIDEKKANEEDHLPIKPENLKLENVDDLQNVIFGSLSKESHFDSTPEDPEDIEHPLAGTFGRRLTAELYGKKIQALCREGKLAEALSVLENEMVAQNVRPDKDCYIILINACGRAGYITKAFNLLHKMKQVGIEPKKHAYTSAFNACATAPKEFQELGLREARTLRKQLQDRGIPITPITYNAMIKAFGRCGDIITAFEVVDEMLYKGHRLTTETMNFLLQACISDKEAGFRHTLMVWRKMRTLKLAPTIHSYNLMLRCTKECRAGDQALTCQLIEPMTVVDKKLKLAGTKKLSNKVVQGVDCQELEAELEKHSEETSSGTFSEKEIVGDEPCKNVKEPRNEGESKDQFCQVLDGDIVTLQLAENMELELVSSSPSEVKEHIFPDVLSRHITPGRVVDIGSLENASDRLALLGGPANVLKNMSVDKITPSIVTFTFLLENIPGTLDAENALLSCMESYGVKPDITFCNILIKKRAYSRRSEEAKNVLDLMKVNDVHPDIITYGCLAQTCKPGRESLKFLEDLCKTDIRPNVAIMTPLIKRNLARREYLYAIELLQKFVEFGVECDDLLLRELEKARTEVRKALRNNELLLKEGGKFSRKEERLDSEMRLFLLEYSHFLKRSNVRLRDHPWAQYGHVDKRGHYGHVDERGQYGHVDQRIIAKSK